MKNAELINHRGRFSIAFRLLDHDFDFAQKVFKDMVVISAVASYGKSEIEYEACGSMFSKVEQFNIAPRYEILTQRDGSITFDLAKVQY